MLGKDDKNTSAKMYDVLDVCLGKMDIGTPIGNAVTFECIKTITSIYPNSKLIDTAAQTISRFITSNSRNLKYLGIRGLINIGKIKF
jgi:AP-4 complex subunit epsilon-1